MPFRKLNNEIMKRRNFIKLSATGSLALHLPNVFASPELSGINEIPKRILGKTGEKISIVGFGGIALRDNGQAFANELIASAYDKGITYFDVAPAYGDSQALMGPAFKPYRKKSFLACKTGKRDKVGAEEELNNSLKELHTDHIDLYQFHALKTMKDLDQVFGANGAMETFVKAREAGKVRFIGFSAHNEEVALKAMDLFDFDTILYPINSVCWYNGNFGPAVYETAVKKEMGILALKAVAKTRVPKKERAFPNMWYKPFEEEAEIDNCLRFTLAKNIAATVHAGDSLFMKKTLMFVNKNKEIVEPELKEVKQMVKGIKPIFSHPEEA
jgi:aryl-alcohol dehydrogenase-like predicted oxidoreductase